MASMKPETSLHYPQIAARIFGQPLLIEQSKLVTILEVLGPRLGIDAPVITTTDAPRYTGPAAHLASLQSARFQQREAGHFVGHGIAVLPIVGSLVQRADAMSAVSGMLGYSRISSMFTEALADPAVREIFLEIDSPGGEVAGVFDLADRMHAARGVKKVTAVVNEVAASAAYLLASVADEIVAPRTGSVGSIGVVTAHFDQSKAMEKRGVAVTFIYAGDKKVDGHPYAPLPDEVRAELQGKIDSIYKMFVETVARNRGMSAEAVRNTKAGMFVGEKAVASGLANRVGTIHSEIAAATLRHRSPQGAATMSKTNTPGQPQGDDRNRIKAILECSDAKGREDLAKYLAFDTELTAQQALAILSKTPKRTSLDDLMDRNGTPGVFGEEVTREAGRQDDFAFRSQLFDGASKRVH